MIPSKPQLNRFGVDLTAVRAQVLQNRAFRLHYEQYLCRGRAPIWVHELERHNDSTYNDITGEWNMDERPRANGHYDHEGHVACDVSGIAWLLPWTRDGLEGIGYMVAEYAKDVRECWRGRIRNLRDLKYRLAAPIRYARYLSLRGTYWLWCVESTYVIRDQIAEDRIEPWQKGSDINAWSAKLDKIRSEVTVEEVQKVLDSDYYRISTAIYARKSDPTCILIDDNLRPYDMKDGYSNQKVARFIAAWYFWVFADIITPYEVKP
jgi:hypothetical protein